MPATPPRLGRDVLAWGAAGLLIALGAQLLFEFFWLRAGFAAVAWVAIGLALLLRRLWDARIAGRRADAVARAGSVVAIGLGVALVSPFLAQLGATIVERFRFERNQAVYDRIVDEVEAQRPAAGRHEVGGQIFLVDPGPPLRVAFPWPGGPVAGWCGAVHDPSGEVMRIEDDDADEATLAAVRGAFGGLLTDCHPLAGESYYLCCFTLDFTAGASVD